MLNISAIDYDPGASEVNQLNRTSKKFVHHGAARMPRGITEQENAARILHCKILVTTRRSENAPIGKNPDELPNGKIWTKKGEVEPIIQYASGGAQFVDDDPVDAKNVVPATTAV